MLKFPRTRSVPDTGTFSVNGLPAEAETLDGITYMIEYKSDYQGYITNSGLIDESVPYILHLYESLTNTFAISDHAFLVLHGYAMAIFKSIYYYVFDSHSRDCNGMPAPNGTAVLMEFHDLSNLKDYICMLSIALNTSYFEIVPVTFTKQIIHCEQQTTCSNSSPGSRTPSTSPRLPSKNDNNRIYMAKKRAALKESEPKLPPIKKAENCKGRRTKISTN